MTLFAWARFPRGIDQLSYEFLKNVTLPFRYYFHRVSYYQLTVLSMNMKWRNGETAKWRNGEMAKWRNDEMAIYFSFQKGKRNVCLKCPKSTKTEFI